MKNSLKKLLGGLCALAVSASMFSGVVFADETETETANMDAVQEQFNMVYNMILDPSIPDSELELMASVLMADGTLGDVVYQLLSYSDADPNSAFFTAASELMDAPTAAILGVEDDVNGTSPDEDAKAEAEVVSTTVKKHTYEIDSANGTASMFAMEDTYGEATSILQTIKSGTNTISKIIWDFDLSKASSTDKSFSIAAVTEGQEDGGENYQEFQLPNIEVNGEFTIGIILENWVPDGDEQEVENTSFVETTFEYAQTSEEENADISDAISADPDESTDPADAETVDAETTVTGDTETADEPAEPAVDAADAE